VVQTDSKFYRSDTHGRTCELDKYELSGDIPDTCDYKKWGSICTVEPIPDTGQSFETMNTVPGPVHIPGFTQCRINGGARGAEAPGPAVWGPAIGGSGKFLWAGYRFVTAH